MNEMTYVPPVPNAWRAGTNNATVSAGQIATIAETSTDNWWESCRIPMCNLRDFPNVASLSHVTATRICNKLLSIFREVFRPIRTLRVVTILVLKFQTRDEFNRRLIRAQFPLTVAVYQSPPKSISDSRQVVERIERFARYYNPTLPFLPHLEQSPDMTQSKPSSSPWTDLITQLVPNRNQFWDARSHFLDEGSHYLQGLYYDRRREKQTRDKQYIPQTGLQ